MSKNGIKIVAAVLVAWQSLGCTRELPRHPWTVSESCQHLPATVERTAQGQYLMKWDVLGPWLHCLNTNKAIAPLMEWVDEWNPSERERVAEWFSEAFLNSNLSVGRAWSLWGQAFPEHVEAAFEKAGTAFADLLEEKDWIQILSRLAQKVEDNSRGVPFFKNADAAMRVLRTVEAASRLPLVKEFFEHVSQAQWEGSTVSWGQAWKGVQAFSQKTHSAPELFDPWKESAKLLADGSFFKSMQNVWGTDPDSTREHLTDAKNLFESVLFRGDPAWVGRIASMIGKLDRPVDCFNGQRTIPNAALLAFDELAQSGFGDGLASFVRRDFRLRVMISGEVCQHPPGVGSDPGIFKELASTEALWPMVRFLRGMDAPMRTWLAHTLAQPFWSDLQPAMAWMEHNHFWGDLLLMSSWLGPEDLKGAQDFFGGVYRNMDVLHRTTERVDPEMLREALSSTADVFLRHREALPEMFRWIRWWMESAQSKDTVLDWDRSWMASAQFLGQVSSKPSYSKAIAFFRQGVQERKWQPIVAGMLQWLKPKSTNLAPAEWLPEPSEPPRPLHAWAYSDLPFRPFEKLESDAQLDACDALDLTKSMGGQWKTVLACVGNGPLLAHIQSAQGAQELPFPLWTAWTHFKDSFFKSKSVETLLQGVENGSVDRWIHQVSDHWDKNPDAWKAWILVWSRLQGKRESRLELFKTLAEGIRSEELSDIFKNGADLKRHFDELPPAPAPEARRKPYDRASLRASLPAWIRQAECLFHPVRMDERIDTILEDYARQVHVNDFVAGRARLTFSKKEFLARWEPIRDVLRAHPETGEALVGYFNKHPQFMDWIAQRMGDPVPILYYYPGEKSPRVRLVNTLDKLELIMVNSNMSYATPKNYALYFIGMIGEAWGDEPRSAWPAEIQKKYSTVNPRTLADVGKIIEKQELDFEALAGYPADGVDDWSPCVGFPDDPAVLPRVKSTGILRPIRALAPLDIQARVFNIRQVLSAFDPQGMKELRDLFWELIGVTPGGSRHASAGRENALWVVTALADLGALDWGLQAWKERDSSDPEWVEVRQGLRRVMSLDSKKVSELINRWIRSDHALETVFDGTPSATIEWAYSGLALLGKLESDHAVDPAALDNTLRLSLDRVSPWIDLGKEHETQIVSYMRVLPRVETIRKLLSDPDPRLRKALWNTWNWVVSHPPLTDFARDLFQTMPLQDLGIAVDFDALDQVSFWAKPLSDFLESPQGALVLTDWLASDPEGATALMEQWIRAGRAGVWSDLLSVASRSLHRP